MAVCFNWFVYTVKPWFIRGWDFFVGASAGVFAFASTKGHADSGAGFRVVLSTMILFNSNKDFDLNEFYS